MSGLRQLLERYLQGETIRHRHELYPHTPTPISRLLFALVEAVEVLQAEVTTLKADDHE